MNLEGAVRMITSDPEDAVEEKEENPAGSDSDDDKENDNDDDEQSGEEELAVDIIDAVQLGSGARITCMVSWACSEDEVLQAKRDEESKVEKAQFNNIQTPKEDTSDRKRKFAGRQQDMEMDPEEIQRARALVAKAKEMSKKKQSKGSKKRQKLSPGE